MCTRKREESGTERIAFLLKESGEDHCSIGQMKRCFIHGLKQLTRISTASRLKDWSEGLHQLLQQQYQNTAS